MTHPTSDTRRTSDSPGIRLAVASDVEPLTTTLVAAFRATPDAVWLIPDPTHRDRIYPQLTAARLAPAINAGHVHTTDDRTAVAIWEPPLTPTPDPGEDDQHLPAVCGRYADRFHTLAGLLAQARPATPHHHLHYLAVHPTVQRQGLGSALLRHHHTRLDTHGEPAALIAVSPESRNLYLRHHYTTTDTIQLPDGPTLWVMWRQPNPPDTT